MTVGPFLKWAGGKRWLVKSADFNPPMTFDRYVEPFLGGGAVFFHLSPQRALLSDINEELINLYLVIRERPSCLKLLVADYQERHSKSFYYSIRSHVPSDLVEKAARTLYLNRTCWNGLFRVNLSGQFNVPKGTKNTVLFDSDDFEAISHSLQGTELRCADFEVILDEVAQGDLVFVDPPYTANHNANGFLKYNERIFSWSDQLRLREAVRKAAERGSSIIVANADHSSITDLYKDLGTYRSVSRHSVLAGDRAYRGLITEALIEINLK